MANGNGPPSGGLPVLAGQQMDVTFLYQRVLELSELLQGNREYTQSILEEVERLSHGYDLQKVHVLDRQGEADPLERAEDAALITDWEHAMDTVMTRLRAKSFANADALVTQAKHYNTMLQEEKDAHLQARVERDEWRDRFARAVEMLRESYRLRCEEEPMSRTDTVAALQEQVRSYRNALGMEAERPEEETGWRYLRQTNA